VDFLKVKDSIKNLKRKNINGFIDTVFGCSK
jgi:hypothetical protein